jgi:predicted phage terminase large subunit-like protein
MARELPAAQRIERYYTAVQAELCRRSLRHFVRASWPLIDPKPFVPAWHIDAICDHLAFLALGEIRNLMVNIPPRFSKSSIVSVAFPAWIWTDEPALQFLCASYSSDLAIADARKMRRLVESPWYKARYPGVTLMSDQGAVESFANSHGGYRESISVMGTTTGKGGDIKIADDLHNAATIESAAHRKQAIEWHDNAFRSRNNDPNTVRNVYVGQRTHDGDIYGHVLAREEKFWTVLSLPMEFDPARKCITYRNKGEGPYGEPIFKDPRTVQNALLCPDRFDEKITAREKAAVPLRTWNAQYQQQPEGSQGIIFKRKYWRRWEWPTWHKEYGKSERPLPEVLAVVQAYDTAFEQSEQDSFTVRTTWGVFEHAEVVRLPNDKVREGDPKMHGILLERRKWRPSFGELRDDAIASAKEWEPDRILVEKKASGHSLIQELRRKELPVRAVKVVGDLVYRAHMASLPLEKGSIWYIPRNWSKDLIEELARFPNVDFNDQVSSCCIAWMYLRRYMDLQLEDDDDNEEDLALFDPNLKRRAGYYG